MPVLERGGLKIDYVDDGAGEPVVLIHSSVSGNRQWRTLIKDLRDRYRTLAVNLFGYGETTLWPGDSRQSLYAQAQLVIELCADLQSPIHLVGHSFGGSVAWKAASLLGPRIGKLILLEPNPFYLLQQQHRLDSFLKIRVLRDHVKRFGSLGDWPKVAERFADYWIGDGAWSSMSDKRRAEFLAWLPPNFYEWDAVMEEATTIAEWRQITASTLVVSARETRRPIREIVEILRECCPHWSFKELSEGGHMAPLTRPKLVNPMIREFLDSSIECS